VLCVLVEEMEDGKWGRGMGGGGRWEIFKNIFGTF
jgi:hypothetical protein